MNLKQEYSQAFTEVYEIFKLMPRELLDKIPNKFIELIEEERDTQYNPNIREPIENQNLKDETVVILSLIYRDFLCEGEKKRKLQEKDAREIQLFQEKFEKELREKYNPDDIFKNRNNKKIEYEPPVEENKMITIQEEKWYQKIFNIVKRLFKRIV